MRDSHSSGPARGAGYGTLIAWARFIPQLAAAEDPPPDPPAADSSMLSRAVGRAIGREPAREHSRDHSREHGREAGGREAGHAVGREAGGPSLLAAAPEPVLQHGFGISVKVDGPGKLIATIDPALKSRYWTAHLSAFGANLLGATVPVEIRAINEPEGTISITPPDVADVVISLFVIGCGS